MNDEATLQAQDMDWIKGRLDLPGANSHQRAEYVLHWNMGASPAENFAAFLRAPVSRYLDAATRRELAARGFHYPAGHSEAPERTTP